MKSLGSESRGDREFREAFFAEDKAICESVQKGMNSRKATGGQLTDMERVVVDFHRFVGSRLFAQPASEMFYDPDAQKVWGN